MPGRASQGKERAFLSKRRTGDMTHLACPYALSVTCLPPSMRWHMPTLAPALLLSTGTKVGIWASWANLFLFWAFVIGAERSLFLMLHIQTEECFRPGQGQPPSPLCAKAGLWRQARGHISSPRGKVHTTWLQTSPFLVPSQLHFLPSGSMGRPGIPAINFSPWLQLDWTGSCSSQPNQH